GCPLGWRSASVGRAGKLGRLVVPERGRQPVPPGVGGGGWRAGARTREFGGVLPALPGPDPAGHGVRRAGQFRRRAAGLDRRLVRGRGHPGGEKVGVMAAVIWAVFPGSGVEWAVYSDSLFVALAAFACYNVMERRWRAGRPACSTR